MLARLPHPLELTARWREGLRPGGDATLQAVLSWIRSIALEDDVVDLGVPRSPLAGLTGPWLGRRRGIVRFDAPSLPGARPVPVTDPDPRAHIRFVVRTRANGGLELVGAEPGWRTILDVRDLVVLERDARHGSERPLRLGLSPDEARCVLMHARASAERFLGGSKPDAPGNQSSGVPGRLSQRTAVAVALWVRGRLRGSVIVSPGPALRTVGQAATLVCQDARFSRLSAADLHDAVFQVGFLHAPRVPLGRHEIETGEAYPNKALFVSEGTRSGAYLPEVFNLFSRRMTRLQPIVESLARDKAGLKELGPRARVEVCEVTDVIESADRAVALRLDGPVASTDEASVRARVQEAGHAACAWLAAIQRDDGSLPLFVRPSSGQAEGTDVVRCAMTAEALAAFGVADGFEPAVDTARRVLAWLDRSRSDWTAKRGLALATMIYRGNAAFTLGDDASLEAAARSVLVELDGTDPGPLVLAHATSFLARATPRHPAAGRRTEALRHELSARFAKVTGPVSLAEWAELGAAFPAGSRTSRDVCDWLRSRQLPSGAFPDTTESDFVYSRGTGKVFEVLALRPDESPGVLDRALGWLLSMQYRPDSAFFVPREHWPHVLGGLRHDYYGRDAWIDAAGHLLLGLARLRKR